MTKQLKKTNTEGVHLHTIEFLDCHLPSNYVNEIIEKTKGKFSKSLIYHVRSGGKKNEEVLLALVELANENKKKKDKIQEIINV